MTARGGPLVGVRVVEFGQVAAGPFVGMLLGDLGADVVKVERPDGDGMRQWPPLVQGEAGTFSGNFASLNRNKRSIVIDLKRASDRDQARKLCLKADVLVENFRPGTLERLGLGYEALASVHPRLVYCSISGYGQSGPYAHKGAFDVTVQAMSGLMSVTGEENRPPVKCGVPVADFVAGLYAAYCIVAALRETVVSGKGTFIDCSMLGSLLGISALQTSEYFGTGAAPRRLGSAHPRNAPYQGFRASDKPFVLAAGNDALWLALCIAVGVPDLADHPRFATVTLRARHQAELASILQAVFARRTAKEWLNDLDAAGVPCAPINSFAEVLADPHVIEMNLLATMELPNGSITSTVRFPIGMSGLTFPVFRDPPALGQHTDEVLREWLGEAPAEVARRGG